MFENPVANSNPTSNFVTGYQAGSDISDKRQQLQHQQQELAQKQAIMQIGQHAAQTGDPRSIAMYSSLNPEGGKAIRESAQFFVENGHNDLAAIKAAKITDRPAIYEMKIAALKKNNPYFDASQYPAQYSPEVDKLIDADLTSAKDLHKQYSAQETSQGLMAFDPSTGQLSPTGVGVYQKPPSTVVNIDNKAETEYAKATGKGLGESDVKYYQEVSDRGDKARQQTSTIDAVEQSLDTIGQTGKFTGIGSVVSNAANQAGFEVDQKKLANIESAKGELNKLVLPETKALGTGNGFTDKDREFLSATFPQITDSYQGNKLKIALARKANARQIEVSELADSLREQGASPFEIRKTIAQKYKGQPVFTKEDFKLAKNPNQAKQEVKQYSPADQNAALEILRSRGHKL